MDLKDSTMKGWVQSQGSPCEIYHSGTGTGYSLRTSVFHHILLLIAHTNSFTLLLPVVYHLTNWQHHEIIHFKEIIVVK